MKKARLSAVNFIRKSRLKRFNNGIVYNRIGFKRICATISRQYTELFYNFFTTATESGWSMGGCNFRSNLPINVPKWYGRQIQVFWQEIFKVVRIQLSEPGLYPSITDIVVAMNKIEIRVCIFKNDWPFRRVSKPQFSPQVFEVVAVFSWKPPTYTIKEEKDETIRGKFYQKELIKVI